MYGCSYEFVQDMNEFTVCFVFSQAGPRICLGQNLAYMQLQV